MYFTDEESSRGQVKLQTKFSLQLWVNCTACMLENLNCMDNIVLFKPSEMSDFIGTLHGKVGHVS